jgi:hypothetical protein
MLAPSSLARLAFLSAVLFASAGCNPSGIHPVEGQVVWKKNQAPATELAGTLVFFEQLEKQISARGQIAADGSFRLTTNNPNDGATLGENTVVLVEIGRKPAGGPDGTVLAPGKLDSRYSTPSTTDLKATIVPGLNKITLTVEPPK